MIRAILFDMGGTLDGDGLHWLDRFVSVYTAAGLDVPRETLRQAFDAAERRSATDAVMMSAHLLEMIERHVDWQLDELALESMDLKRARLRQVLITEFVKPMHEAGRRNAPILASLQAKGFALGVVSNGCGNVDVLCQDLGYEKYLSLIVDSRRVGLFKPDPAIYAHAAAQLKLPPESILMVGDSFERDIVPARSIGMRTALITGQALRLRSGQALRLRSGQALRLRSGQAGDDQISPDITLNSLAELPGAIERTFALAAHSQGVA